MTLVFILGIIAGLILATFSPQIPLWINTQIKKFMS